MKLLLLVLTAGSLLADGPGRLESKYVGKDLALSADPSTAAWKQAKPVIADKDRFGKPVPGHRTEIRSVWTDTDVHFLFVGQYDKLFLKPGKWDAKGETNKLWEWDVAEVFVGEDHKNIHLYKEFEMSPRGEWVDLDIDKSKESIAAIKWDSGFTVKARIDEQKKIWYGEMKIPLASISKAKVKAGTEMRLNCYRIQNGPGDARVYIAWNPIMQNSYHTPEMFGRLVMVK